MDTGISSRSNTCLPSSVMRTASFGIPHSTFSGSLNGIDRIDVPPNGTSHSSRWYVPDPKTNWVALPDFWGGLAYSTRNCQVARDVSTTGYRVRCDLTKICSLVNWLPLLCREQVPSANRNFGLSCGPLLGTAGRAGIGKEDKVCDRDDWYSYDSYCY